MSELRGIAFPVAALALVLVAPSPRCHAAPPDGMAPPRVKPLAEQVVGIQPWETVSSSPFGGSRMGGTDERGFAFSPDGKQLVTEDAGGWQLELWDTATGKSLGRFGKINDPVGVAFAPDGQTLVTAEQSHHDVCSVTLWDVARRTPLRHLDEDVNVTPFTAVAFAPDGKTLALGAGWGRRSAGNFAIHLWDVASGDESRRFAGPAPFAEPGAPRWRSRLFDCLGFAPDGRSLALVADNKVLLWEVVTGKERCLLGVLPPTYSGKERSGERGACLAFSPDGRTLAVGCPDGAVRLWDILRGHEMPPLAGHRGGVRAVWYAPDGKTLRSLGADNKLLTWPVTGPFREWRPQRDKLSEDGLQALWNDLSGADALARYGAVRNLAAFPAQALPVLRQRLKPVPAVDSPRIARLVADLEKDDFNERKKAAAELRQLGDLALPALRQANEARHGDIQRRILEKMESQYPTRDQLPALRALEALEQMGAATASPLLADLAKGAPESVLTRQAKAVLERLPKARGTAGEEATLEMLWTDLAGDDARRAYQAVRALTGQPDRAVSFLRDRLRKLADLEEFDDDPRRIARLIGDLDRDEFATREKASTELAKLGTLAEPALRKALEGTPSLEAKQRMENLLKDVVKPGLSPEKLRAGRALEALEQAGTAEARQALEVLGKESHNRWLKEVVADSLRRLGK